MTNVLDRRFILLIFVMPTDNIQMKSVLGEDVANLKVEDNNIERDQKDIIRYCEKAIEAYTQSLKACDLERSPKLYAMIQSNLANIYVRLGDIKDKAENYKKAIDAYNEALKSNSISQFPVEYAIIQFNLGNTYSKLADLEEQNRNKYSEKAIEAYSESLKVFTRESFPTYYVTIQNNIGNEYGKLAGVENIAISINNAKYGNLM